MRRPRLPWRAVRAVKRSGLPASERSWIFKELNQLARAVNGHAEALVWQARMMVRVARGDVRQWEWDLIAHTLSPEGR